MSIDQKKALLMSSNQIQEQLVQSYGSMQRNTSMDATTLEEWKDVWLTQRNPSADTKILGMFNALSFTETSF